MAIERTCDRCGLQITDAAPYNQMQLCDFRAFLATYDLCESCMRSARDWVDEFAESRSVKDA